MRVSCKVRWRPRGSISTPVHNLFVYGTLRRRGKNEFARLLHANADFLGEATLQARITGTRPHRRAELSRDPAHQLPGEIFRVNHPEKIFPILDQYEGADYQRTLARPRLDSGRSLKAWIYLYTG